MVRGALVHENGRSRPQGPVDNVAVAGHPADVRGAEIDVVVLEVEDVLHRQDDPEEVARAGMQDPLGLSGRAAGVEDVKGMLARECLRPVPGGLAADGVVPPYVAALGHRDVLAGSLQDDHALDARRSRQRPVDARLKLDHLAPPPAAVGGDDDPRLAVVDAVLDRLARESPEDDGVDDPDPRARQHRHRGLRHHRHVDRHPVPLHQAHALEDMGERADLPVKLAVGQCPHVPGLALEDDCGFVGTAVGQMPVEAVFGNIELSPFEPLGMRQLPTQDLLERPAPVEKFLRLSPPELLGRVDRFGIQLLIQGFAPKIGLGFELGRWPDNPGFPGY